jgi:hypothetical protein
VRIALPWIVDDGFERWILIRRNRKSPEERAYYLVFSRTGTALSELAGAAGPRWTIEECFQRAKEEVGLDHCKARSWHGWQRHMTPCMAAAVFWPGYRLSFVSRPKGKGTKGVRGPRRVSLTVAGLPGVPESRDLMARLVLKPIAKAAFIIRWLQWRCRHQAMAARCHYGRRGNKIQLLY